MAEKIKKIDIEYEISEDLLVGNYPGNLTTFKTKTISLKDVEIRSDSCKFGLEGVKKLYIYLDRNYLLRSTFAAVDAPSLLSIYSKGEEEKFSISRFNINKEDLDAILGLRVDKIFEGEEDKRVFYEESTERIRGWYSFEEEDLDSIEESYKKTYGNNSEMPHCFTSIRKVIKMATGLAKEIKDSKKFIFDKFYRGIPASYLRGIFDRVDKTGPLFVLENSGVTLQEGHKEAITLEFADWGDDSTITKELLIFDSRYNSIYGMSFFLMWKRNLFINLDRPLLDPLRDLFRATMDDCKIINKKDNKISYEIKRYPMSCDINSFFSLDTFRTTTFIAFGGSQASRFSFEDSIIDKSWVINKKPDYASYIAHISLTPEQMEVLRPNLDKFQFPDLTDFIEKTFPDLKWEINLNEYNSLFPPFERIKVRLEELGIHSFEYSSPVIENFYQNSEIIIQDPEKEKELILSYLDYLGSSELYKTTKFIDLKESVFSYDFRPGSNWCPSVRSHADTDNSLERFLARRFYAFYEKHKDEIDPTAREYYFGSNSPRCTGDEANNYILRKPWLGSIEYTILFSGKDEIQIETKPLIQFVSAGLNMGMSVTTILKALIGDDYIGRYYVNKNMYHKIFPSNGKAMNNSPEIVNEIINIFIKHLKSNSIIKRKDCKIVIK
jgi:hypothetical protein